MTNEPEFRLWDIHPLIPLLRFADVEASGLHDGSYPVQFGWCGIDMKTSVVLVKPEPEWPAHLFDPKAFEMHGISHDKASVEGMDASEVVALLNGALGGHAVVSDNPQWDDYWTDRLARTTGLPVRFGFNPLGKMPSSIGSVFDPWCVAREDALGGAVDCFYPHTHQADEDALRMAALTRMYVDREWAEWLLSRS